MFKLNRKDGLAIIFLLLFTGLTFGYRMGSLSLTDPDEVFYAQTAKEMLQQKTWGIPYIFGQPQFEKPILFYFLLAVTFKFFGISTTAARVWPCLFGIFGVVLTYIFGAKLYGRKTGLISAIVLATGLEYLALSRAVLTDIVFSVLLAAALMFFYLGFSDEKQQTKCFIAMFVFSALATLTKGPIGIILLLLVIFVFLLLKGRLDIFASSAFLKGLAVFAVVCLPWYIYICFTHGRQFFADFILRDNLQRFFYIAEHEKNDTWYFYPLTTLGCFIPWAPFLAAALFKMPWRQPIKPTKDNHSLFLICWTVIIFFFFQMAKSKLTSYVFPIFPALAIITGRYFKEEMYDTSGKRHRVFVLGMVFIALAFVSLGLYGLYYNKQHNFLPWGPALVPLFCLGLPSLLALIFSLFRKYRWAFGTIAASIVLLVIVGQTFLIKYIDPWVSSRESAEILKRRLAGKKTTIVSNKFFARGLLYYTDLPIVVMDTSPRPFFASHPIPVVYTNLQIILFFQSQPETYCVVKKGNFKKINFWKGWQLKIENLYQDKGRYIVRVVPIK
ncbi:MAG: ArnT family glycosyltransferase [Candidatus Omnitrophota bacterium]